MTTINTNSKPQAREPGGPATRRRSLLGSRAVLSSLGALGATALLIACAGELDKDPDSFTNAFASGTTGGTTGTGGGSATGGAMNTGGSGTTGGASNTGGGSSTGGGGAVPPDDPCVANVFSAQGCSTSCHSKDLATVIGAGLNLAGPDLGARLSTTKATYMGVTKNPTACVQGALIIDPTTPANSILLKKVSGMQACGDPMPQGGPLTGSDLQCITDWVNKF